MKASHALHGYAALQNRFIFDKVYIPLTDDDFGQQGLVSINSRSMHLSDRILFLDISIFFPDVFLSALTHLKEIWDFLIHILSIFFSFEKKNLMGPHTGSIMKKEIYDTHRLIRGPVWPR